MQQAGMVPRRRAVGESLLEHAPAPRAVPAPSAAPPVSRSHICHGVSFMIASTKTQRDVEIVGMAA